VQARLGRAAGLWYHTSHGQMGRVRGSGDGGSKMSDFDRVADLAPADYCDPVIEADKKDGDRTLLRENLKLTVQQRFEKFESFMRSVYELREAGRRARAAEKSRGA